MGAVLDSQKIGLKIQSSHIPLPPHMHSLPHCRPPLLEWYIGYNWWTYTEASLSLRKPLVYIGSVQPVDFDKCVMMCIQHCSITQNSFTALQVLWVLCNQSLQPGLDYLHQAVRFPGWRIMSWAPIWARLLRTVILHVVFCWGHSGARTQKSYLVETVLPTPIIELWFIPQLKYPCIFREYLAKLFRVPVPLFLRVILIFFVSICIWLVCLSIKSCCSFSSRRGTVALFIQENVSKKEVFKTFSRWSTLPSVRGHTP